MSHRSRRYRKLFPSCGHKGFGKYCHRCSDLSHRKQAIALESKLQHSQWIESYSHDSIDLTHLPKPIVLRARQLLEHLAQGTEYYKLQGKRLLGTDRNLIRIPVTRRYRLLVQDVGNNTFQSRKVLSHEAYNAIARRGL
jgi:DNA mismatch repair ATPase MutS